MAILYSASKTTTVYNYNIVITVDGMISTAEYENEYTLYQFRAYPNGSYKPFTYTKLDTISFTCRLFRSALFTAGN